MKLLDLRAATLPGTLLLALATTPALSAQTRLEMGKMWTFENPPLGYLEQEYGFKPDQAWLDALRMASLRLASKCSASFVSPKGLIMTNNHCVRDDVAQIQEQADYVENGFYASTMEDEKRLEGLTVHQLVSMRDVTKRMLEGIKADDPDAVAEEKREANEAAILADAQDQQPDLDPQIVTLHNGAVYQLYQYKVWTDIRLVCTPHLQSAHFGGDPDNFTYPRYCMDFAFLRAYEDGAPADTSKHYFRWNQTGALEGDLVFVTGNPGSTGRLLTLAQMEYLRDAEYPLLLQMLEHRLAILRETVKSTPERERRLRTIILGDENSVKAITGYLGGLLDDGLMQHKQQLEAEFRAKVDEDPALKEQFSGVWDELTEICEKRTVLEPGLFFHVPSYSGRIAKGLALLQAVDPDVPEEQRKGARTFVLNAPVRDDPLIQTLFVDHLARAKDWLSPDDPYMQAVVGDLDPESAARRIFGSKMSDRQFVSDLIDGGKEAIDASDDPAIIAARAILPLMKAHEAESEELLAREAVQSRLVGQALFACYGDKISPDATMTLRFSDGRVEGYQYNGTVAPYRTSFYGLYARNHEFGDEYPFNLPDVWLEKRDSLDMTQAVNFTSTNDIIGGNSGSPVVDANLQIVGLIFDGNIEQLPNRFLFRDDVERSVSVHVEAIIESMKVIYGADRVVAELLENSGN